MLQRQAGDDKMTLRDLFKMVGDKAAAAAIDREIMGQTDQIEVTVP